MDTKTSDIIPSSPAAVNRGVELETLINDWYLHLELQARAGEISENTGATYRRGWGRFQAWLVNAGITQVDSDVVLDWIASLRQAGSTPNSIDTWLAGVRAFFAWAAGARRLTTNPTQGVKGIKRGGTTQRHLKDILTDEEVIRVLAVPERSTRSGARDYAMLVLKAYCAVRDVELQRADLADLRTPGGECVLYVQGKGHQSADDFVVLPPVAESAVYDWLAVRGNKPGALFVALGNRGRGNRLSLRFIRGMVKACYLAAGVRGDRKTSHSLRHTAISNAIQHGAPLQKVRSMARHARIDTTMIYVHESDRVSDPAENYIKYDARAR